MSSVSSVSSMSVLMVQCRGVECALWWERKKSEGRRGRRGVLLYNRAETQSTTADRAIKGGPPGSRDGGQCENLKEGPISSLLAPVTLRHPIPTLNKLPKQERVVIKCGFKSTWSSLCPVASGGVAESVVAFSRRPLFCIVLFYERVTGPNASTEGQIG